MVMHAKLSSGLTGDRLSPSFDAAADHVRQHGMSVDKGHLLFDHLRGMPSGGFIRESGLDLATGDLHVGGVQFEASVRDIVAGIWDDGQFQSMIQAYSGDVSGAPLAFELERLFTGGVLPIEVVEMFADGNKMGQWAVEKQNTELQAWCEQYAQAVRDSLIGKPMAEADYARRSYGRYARRLPRHSNSILYGDEVAEELSRLRRSDLRKYL